MRLRDKQYIYRKNFTKILKDTFRLFFYYEKYFLASKEVKKSNQEIDRFVEGNGFIGDNLFKYVDLPSFNFIKNELFNLEIYKFKTTKKKPFIIDCGANIGLSVYYFKKLYPDCRIIAFEPDPKVFKVLNFNINNLKLEDCSLHCQALWINEGSISFFSEGADGGRIQMIDDKNSTKMNIECTKLSSFINEEVDFLKIDIEGAEFDVLNECKHKLHYINNLFIEYHSMVNQRQNLSDLLTILTDNGFRYYISSIGIHSAHPFIKKNETLGMDNQLNIFATKDKLL